MFELKKKIIIKDLSQKTIKKFISRAKFLNI